MPRSYLLTVVLILLSLSCLFCDEITGSQAWPRGQVLDLNADTFPSAIHEFEYILVDFYAPWCGHCKHLNFQLDLAAKELELSEAPIAIAKIDVEKHTRIASQYGISVYPTVKFFVNGFPTDYQGSRKAGSIVSYLRRAVAPPVTTLDTEASLKTFVERAGVDEPIIIGFGLPQALLETSARRYKSKAWFAVIAEFSDDVMFEYDFNKRPSVVALHKKYDEQDVFYGPLEENELAEFVRQNLLPLVTPLTPENIEHIKEDGRMVLLAILRSSTSEMSVAFRKKLKAAAPANRAFLFAYLDATEWPAFARSFSVGDKSPLPAVVIWDCQTSFYAGGNPQGFSGEVVESRISTLLDDFKSGRLTRAELMKPPLLERLLDVIGGTNSALVLLGVLLTVGLVQTLDWRAASAQKQQSPENDRHDKSNTTRAANADVVQTSATAAEQNPRPQKKVD